MDNINKRIIFQGAVNQMELDPFGIHGVNHWFMVYNNAMNIYRTITDEYAVAHELDWFFWSFAMLRECCRL